MYYSNVEVVLQEVPGEISICFSITGCKLHCGGCHSTYLWKEGSGKKLTDKKYITILQKYKGFASCVLFMGGEWHLKELIEKLRIAKSLGYSTCLYTGLNEVSNNVSLELTWLKKGPWIQELGGLDNKKSNQQFIEVKSNKKLNHLFIKNKS